MKHIYLKPQLENLSQGERIAFVRQFRRMNQDEVSDKLGLDGENHSKIHFETCMFDIIDNIGDNYYTDTSIGLYN